MSAEEHHTRKKLQPTAAHVHATGALAVLALAAAGYALGYAPMDRAQEQAAAQSKAIQRARSESIATSEHLERAATKLQTLRSELGDALQRARNPEAAIQDSASQASLMVHTLTTGDQEELGELQRTSLTMHASGSFSDIIGWLADVDSQLPGVVVQGFSISSADASQSSLTFQASLSVYAPKSTSSAHSDAEQGSDAQASTGPAR